MTDNPKPTKKEQEQLDEALEESFPGARADPRRGRKTEEEKERLLGRAYSGASASANSIST